MPAKTKQPYSETLDYKALDAIQPLPKLSLTLSMVLPFVFVAVLLVGSQLIALKSRALVSVFHSAIGICFLAGIIIWSYRFRKLMSQQSTQLPQFAADNGLTYDDSPNFESISTLFTLGHDQATGARIKGAVGGYPYALYWHRYATGYGRSRIDYYYDVVEIDLPKLVPQIYLDHRDLEYVAADPIGQVFGARNLHQLEGDFSKRYKVYFNQVYASDALTLLNPLFMQHLLDKGLKYDMEFAGKKLFIYSQESFDSNTQKFKSLFDAAEFMVGELARQFDTFIFVPKHGDQGSMYTKAVPEEAAAQFGW